jgi:D-alanyl-lipoteichoic acid acyltransferase DltB (MBOAT superfamily)
MITMVLGGLWHGAAWTFVAWGAIHGSGQVVGHVRRSKRVAAGLDPVPDGRVRVWVQRFVTFHIVCLGWIFFRADSISTATTLIGRLFSAWGRAPLVTPLVVITVVGAVALQYLPRALGGRAQRELSGQPWAVQGAILGVFLLVITTLGPQGVAPFIYYKF